MKFLYILVVALLPLHSSSDTVYMNKIFDNQLFFSSQILRVYHVKYITVGDVEIGDNIKATNVHFGDVSKVVRKGDVSLSAHDDEIDTSAAVGIDKMFILMDTLELNGRKYNKVLVVVGTNALSYKVKYHTTKTDCKQNYTDIHLSKVSGVMLYSRPKTKMNVTSQFIKQVVPFINDQLAGEEIRNIIDKYINACKTPKPAKFMEYLAMLRNEGITYLSEETGYEHEEVLSSSESSDLEDYQSEEVRIPDVMILQ